MFRSKAICLAASVMLALAPVSACLAADPQLNFKIYSPQDPPADAPKSGSEKSDAAKEESSIFEDEQPAKMTPAEASTNTAAPVESAEPAEPAAVDSPKQSAPLEKLEASPEPASSSGSSESTVTDAGSSETGASSNTTTNTTTSTSTGSAAESTGDAKDTKVLQGHVSVVPTGTKIPIVMDTAVDSDTSQEGDEFSARTSEDLNIDGSTIVPAGSIIKGRIATLNAPRALSRSGSVALKFDTITTPDNRQIPLVANLVARGGVVHARRGMKDVAIDAGTIAGPMAAGLLIGLLAGKSSTSSSSSSSSSSSGSHMSKGAAAALGAGIGLAVGVAVLMAKKGKKVDVRPGDELKIELAEDLRMPTM